MTTTTTHSLRRESLSSNIDMTAVEVVGAETSEVVAASKPKRVRTGCLTCRERHLKCDESLPHCINCRKSNRLCKRGVRLNFIDTQVKDPPIIPKSADWKVIFQDESRDIASEYRGGLGRYAHLDTSMSPPAAAHFPVRPSLPEGQHFGIDNTSLPPLQMNNGPFSDNGPPIKQEYSHSRQASRHQSIAGSDASSYMTAPRSASVSNPEQRLTPPSENRASYLSSPEEVLFMQVFVEEVGIWMDSMDSMKHFSKQLPFHALGEPMLLNAFLACGARHLTLVNPAYHEDKALLYYDTATTQLLRALQDPERDTVCCATTAVILNVYEIMSERAMQRMNHIAGARALIKECGWNARSSGIGAACFWLNVGMEILSCLHFNWQVAWDPDQWGLDMNFQQELESGREEIWVHRILYIVGKIANFRASTPNFREAVPHDEQMRIRSRMAVWQELKRLCDAWNDNIPRTMQPIGYLHSAQTTSKSAFPEVWLIKRATIVGRLFYHTAMVLLAQLHPLVDKDTEEMRSTQMHHAQLICGIVAHVKDRGVASVALRSLAIAAECLVVRREQEEVLEIFEKIRKETGWKVGFLHKELKIKWGWVSEDAPPAAPQASGLGSFFPNSNNGGQGQNGGSNLPPAPPVPPRSMPSGIMNPLLSTADFSLQKHPYQNYYTPPSHLNHFAQTYT